MLSAYRPFPSMLFLTPSRSTIPVKASLVNWLPLVGVEDLRLSFAQRLLEGLEAEAEHDTLGPAGRSSNDTETVSARGATAGLPASGSRLAHYLPWLFEFATMVMGNYTRNSNSMRSSRYT